jgi:hypothetical protein
MLSVDSFSVPVHSRIFSFHVVSCFQSTILFAFVYNKMPRICKYIQSSTRVCSVKSSIESGYVHQQQIIFTPHSVARQRAPFLNYVARCHTDSRNRFFS